MIDLSYELGFQEVEAFARGVANGVFQSGFGAWLAVPVNRTLWRRFMAEADRVRLRGRTHYSGRTIIEVLRHETMARDGDPVFKINNKWIPDLVRLYTLMTNSNLFHMKDRK